MDVSTRMCLDPGRQVLTRDTGPVLGPLIGGFIVQKIGWRWDFWIVLIIAVLLSASIELLGQETNYSVIIQKKTKCLRKKLGRRELRSCYENIGAEKLSTGSILRNGLYRPVKLLFLSPIVLRINYLHLFCVWHPFSSLNHCSYCFS